MILNQQLKRRIEVLPEDAINKIAAGEVIENSASVIKELIDNSLDAGASDIRVQVVAGGRQRIVVADDGCGMAGDEVLLAFERHATSKIRRAEDLVEIATLGFRGEALASIAAVSRVSLLTSEGDMGSRVEISGGRVLRCEPAARAHGTTVEVCDLFFNTPVRRRFQRTVASDRGAIQRVVGLLALAHPDVRFRLTSDDQLALNATSVDLEERVSEVLGPPFMAGMESLEACDGSIALRGFVGTPAMHKPNRIAQYIFINRRPVRSRLISDAVREGYGGRLPERRFPAFVLFLNLRGDLVDCNVHPQKREVRLRDEPLLHRIISTAVRSQFEPDTPSIQSAPVCEPMVLRPVPRSLPRSEQIELVLPQLRLAALVGRYAFVEGIDSHLAIVDLRAAYRRVAYTEFTRPTPAAQLLLAPITLHLAPREAQLAEEHLEALQSLGFGMRSLGGEAFLVDAVPPRIGPEAAEEALINLLDHLTHTSDVALEAASATAPRRFSEAEALELVGALMRIPEHQLCPRDTPVFVSLSEEELRRRLFPV